ncbi:MAG TPA: alpha/beta hydrolase [Solirubrobacterales bacterium]|nr:alpha/beta hydrolase [Solirubrobacterales bacterium]
MRRPLPEVEGVKHRFVKAGGLGMHVAEAGSGPPLLMLHGWPQHWWMWRALIGPLARDHRVLCPDLRGFGWSEAPPGGYDPEVFASDLVALLDELEVDGPVDLVGHDWGGWTGFMLCLRHPARVRRFLALNILHPFGRASPTSLLHAWRFWYQWPLAAPALLPGRLGARAAWIEPSLAWVGGREAGWSPRERAIFTEQFREPERAMAAALLYRHALLELLPATVRGKYAGCVLNTPTLLLFGTGDRVQHHSLLRGFERNAPDMELELVPGVGHFIADERPELVLDRAQRLFAV